MSDTKTDNSWTKSRPVRRVWVVLVIALLVLVMLPVVGYWFVTRPAFLAARLTPILERSTGGEVDLQSVHWLGDGLIRIEDFRLRAPGVDGLSGEVVTVGEATLQLDLSQWWRHPLQVRSVELNRVHIRLTEFSDEPGQFSFRSLQPQSPVTQRALPPSIEVRNAVVEMALHDVTRAEGERYVTLGARRVAGQLRPMSTSARSPEYRFDLWEVDSKGRIPDGGIVLNGQWNATTFANQMDIQGLKFDEQTKQMCPQIIRTWWEEMDLQGRLSNAEVQWDGQESFVVRFNVEDVGMKLPFTDEEDWARFHEGRIIGESSQPRMHVESGEIRLEHDRLVFSQLSGELLSGREDDIVVLPYTVNAEITDIPLLEEWETRHAWMDEVLATVPFEMKFNMPEFRVAPREDGTTPAVDLPFVVADMLSRFQLTDWRVRSEVNVFRGKPVYDEATGELRGMPIQTSGQLRIQDAAGMFHGFNYRLNRVRAHINFTQDTAELVFLHGHGTDGAVVRMEGRIAPPGSTEAMDLSLTAENVPVDSRLRDALGGKYLELFDNLLHVPAFESLRDSGMLLNEATHAELDVRSSAIRQQLRDLVLRRSAREEVESHTDQHASVAEINAVLEASLRVQHDRIDRMQLFREFALGGTVGLDFRIHRPAGDTGDPNLTGTITLDSVGLIHRRFPYPFIIERGVVRWEPDHLTILESEKGALPGLRVITPGGGSGLITGSVTRIREDDRDRILPNLEIAISNDQVNDVLLAVIPPSADDRESLDDPERWPGHLTARPAQLLRDMQVDGMLDYVGRIEPGDDRRARYEFLIQFTEGSAKPTAAIAEAIGAAGLLWPQGFSIGDMNGALRVTPDAVELTRLVGEHDDGHVSATGELLLNIEPRTTDLTVDFSDLPFDRYLVNLVPGDHLPVAHEWWDRYQPAGRFDASLAYRAVGRTIEPLKLHVIPTHLDVMLGDVTVSVSHQGGSLAIQQDSVSFERLDVRLQRGEQDDGRAVLTGSYGFADEDNVLEVRGQWQNGRLDSPAVIEAMRLLDAGDHIEQYQALNPAGQFDTRFSYTSPRNGEDHNYWMRLNPSTVQLTLRDTELGATLDEDSNVVFRRGEILLNDVSGSLGEDTFAIDGIIDTNEQLTITVDVAYEGRLMGRQAQALLPPEVADVLRTIQFHDGVETRIRDADIRAAYIQNDETGEAGWQTGFTGRIHTEGASLNPGVSVTELDSTIQLDMFHRANAPLELTIDLVGHEFRAYGHKLSDLRVGEITIDEDGRTLHLRDLQADSYGGAVWGEATIGTGSDANYELRVDLVGLSLHEMFSDGFANHAQTSTSGSNAAASRQRPKLPDGKVYGSIKLQGEQGKPESRSGRGVVRAIGGDLEAVPILLQLVQMIQLTVPLRDDFDNADITFYVDGDRVVFERILFESTLLGDIATLQLLGRGEMDFNTFELNTQFRSRSGLLLVRELVGGLGDQLYVIEITGHVADPKARLVPLPGLVRGLFGEVEPISAAPTTPR